MRQIGPLLSIFVTLSGCYLFHREPGDRESPTAAERVEVTRDASTAAGPCMERRLRAGERFEPVDMVWVVDSSRSMADEQARIEQTMNSFVRDAEARNFDVRLVMVTARNIVPAPLGSDAGRYRFVQREVGSEAPLEALLEELPRYETFLRPEAALHFVVVTDDDSALDARTWQREMERRLGRTYVVHAVASPDVDGMPCRTAERSERCANAGLWASRVCGAAEIGREYHVLAESSGGLSISICIGDWREVFGPLLEAVTPTEIPCELAFGPEADLAATQVELRSGSSAQRLVQVAGPLSCGAQPSAYYFADHSQGPQLTLCPLACEATRAEGVELRVASDCEGPL